MSVTSPVRDRSIDRPWNRLFAPLACLAFWCAIVLPAVVVPLLLSGVASNHFGPFLALLATNAVAVVLGRNHDP